MFHTALCSVAFTLGFVAGSKVSVASDDAPALPAAAASAKEVSSGVCI